VQLKDAGGGSSVDLFTRMLKVRAPARSSVPGLATEDQASIADPLVVIHELEHVTALSRPIGWVLTLLVIRTNDERNACAKLINEAVECGDPSTWAAAHNVQLAVRLRDWHRWAISTRYVVEALLPVLEGLALYAEGSLPVAGPVDAPMSFDVFIALLHGVSRDWRSDTDAPESATAYVALWQDFLPRLAAARNLRSGLSDDSTERLFLGPSSGGRGTETAPYFLGYLYVVRLLARWRAATEGRLSDLELTFAANRFVGDVLAAILPLVVRNAVREGDPYGKDVLVQLYGQLRAALEFDSDDIELLAQSEQPLTWNLGRPAESDLKGVDPTIAATRLPLEIIFDGNADAGLGEGPADGNATSRETLDILLFAERAKNLHLLSDESVQLLGHDDTKSALILNRATGRQTAFEVQPVALRRFLEVMEARDVRCVDVGSQKGQTDNPPVAVLQTWLETWPDGWKPGDVEAYLGLAKIRRVLIVPAADAAILDRATPEDRVPLMQARVSTHAKVVEAANQLIADWDVFRGAAGRADEVFMFADDPYRYATEMFAELSDPNPAIVRNCRWMYVTIVFPAADRPNDVIEQKLDLVFDALAGREHAQTALSRFLRAAVWRAQPLAARQVAPDQSAVDLIRTTSMRILGIPLMAADGLEFDLEPPG
jgi:hypothetical protein